MMKNKKLLVVLIIIILVIGIQLVWSDKNGQDKNGQLEISKEIKIDKFNHSHISTEINAGPREYSGWWDSIKCETDYDCSKANKNAPEGFWSCLKCPEGKTILPYGKNYFVIDGSKDNGFCIQPHVNYLSWKHYYQIDNMVGGLGYCIYQWSDQEYISSSNMNDYLEIFKEFINTEGISKEYFNKHIQISEVKMFGATPKTLPYRGKIYEMIQVKYVHFYDWFGVQEYIDMPIRKFSPDNERWYDNPEIYSKSIDEISGAWYNLTSDDIKQELIERNRGKEFREIKTIISESQAINKLKKDCSPYFDNGSLYIMKENGIPILRLGGTINYKENKCISAEINLETGEMLYCEERKCWWSG